MTAPYAGGCLCGDTRYRSTADPFSVCFCHCESCRRASGGASVPWASVAKMHFEFHGADPIRYESSAGVVRTFCGCCGSSLTYERTAETSIDFTLATLDDPASLTPTCHIWVADQPEWLVISDDLPQYPGWRSVPDEDD